MADVYVFGDSHWRVFFPFVNHGAATDNVSHTQDGVTTIDTIANELSGATMWGLLNENSKNGARRRILGTLDRLGGADNVGLVFGEVDARFHHDRYFFRDELSAGRLYELIGRYARFIDEDLIGSGRVRGNVFVYHGFAYPSGEGTLLQPGQPIGHALSRAEAVNQFMSRNLETFLERDRVHTIVSHPDSLQGCVSADGVHLTPELIYPRVLDRMKSVLG